MSVYKFVESARSHIGKSFGWRGRGDVLDCVGLIIESFKSCGIECPDVNKYDRKNLGASIMSAIKDWGVLVKVKDMADGDIVLMRNEKGAIEHCAILAPYVYGDFSLVHAHREMGVVEHVLDIELKKQFVAVYRYPWEPLSWLEFGGTYYHDEGSDVWLGRTIDYLRLEDENVFPEAV